MENEHLDIILYTSYLHCIGGIETFILNFIDMFDTLGHKSSRDSIGIICPQLDIAMKTRLEPRVKILAAGYPVSCDTLIMIRQKDVIPRYVDFQKSIRMCHSCKSSPSDTILSDCDMLVHVSEASKQSYQSKGEVIHNPLLKDPNKALIFVSATRIPARDKGENADRMLKLAQKLEAEKLPFLWFNFSDAPLKNAPRNLINVGKMQDLQQYIAKADYLVQLSDHEGFGYSVLEALVSGTAVLCTEFETVHELGIEDGKNGYIVPFDLDFDLRKLWNVPKFEYFYNNVEIYNQWEKLIKTKTPERRKETVRVKVVVRYKDLALNEWLVPGTIERFTKERAEYLQDKGYVKIMEG